jgi:YHS domain-containing protein
VALLLRILLVIAVVWSLWRLLRGVLEGAGFGQGGSLQPPMKLVKDPVCGVYVSPQRALAARAGGETAYFCSEKCRQQWERRSP